MPESLAFSGTETLDVTPEQWVVYLIQSQKNGNYYIGISNNVERRLSEHNNDKGARSTRGKGPWVLIGVIKAPGQGAALRIEIAAKKIAKSKKEQFFKEHRDAIPKTKT